MSDLYSWCCPVCTPKAHNCSPRPGPPQNLGPKHVKRTIEGHSDHMWREHRIALARIEELEAEQ